MDHLSLVWQVGEVLLASVPFREEPEGARHNTLLATQEILTNVLRYAHRGDDSIPVEVEIEAGVDGYAIEIRDQGPPFDPLVHVATADLEAEGDLPSRPGGFGLLIVRMVMDSLEYRRDGGRNVLRMEKLVQARSAVGGG
jgi:anti-sigma regulatory factor (Ser/Thr protein kinase)